MTAQRVDTKDGSKLDFQTIRPPHLWIGVVALLLPFIIMASSITLAMINYSWVSMKAGFITIMASAAIICGFNFLLLTGRPKILHLIQFLVLLYVLVPLALVFAGKLSWLVLGPILMSMLFIGLTFSTKLWMFLYFFKIIWDRHRERKGKKAPTAG